MSRALAQSAAAVASDAVDGYYGTKMVVGGYRKEVEQESEGGGWDGVGYAGCWKGTRMCIWAGATRVSRTPGSLPVAAIIGPTPPRSGPCHLKRKRRCCFTST